MKRWRWFLILITMLALASLTADALFGWTAQGIDHGFVEKRFEERVPYVPPPPPPLLSTTAALLTLFFSGVFLMLLFPRRIGRVARAVSVKPVGVLRLALVGFLTGLLVTVVSATSALAIGTFPLTVMLMAALFFGGLFGATAFAYALGRGLLRRAGWEDASPLYALLLGELILYALVRLPWVGWAALLFFASLGLGATLVSHLGSGEPWTLKLLLEAEKE